MLTEKEIQDLCYKELCKLNLGPGCNDFVRSIVNGNTSSASAQLQQIIHLSISRCIHTVLKESNNL